MNQLEQSKHQLIAPQRPSLPSSVSLRRGLERVLPDLRNFLPPLHHHKLRSHSLHNHPRDYDTPPRDCGNHPRNALHDIHHDNHGDIHRDRDQTHRPQPLHRQLLD